MRALSIGFEVIAHSFDQSVRVIQKGRIREVSLVLFPANERAQILAVKEETPESGARALIDFCLT